jgi:cell wall-associated NlpC family hydrolase
MRRLAFLCLLIVLATVPARAAVAGGPVFDVVPSGATGSVSLNQAIRRQLAADRLALRDSRHRQSVTAASLERAKAEVARAADPFPAEDRAGRLQQALAAEQARATGIRRAIKRLELALRPVSLPADVLASGPTAVGSYAVTIAKRYLDVRYVWGGDTPSSGFDCSGFVQYVYAQLGIKLPHYAASQYAMTPHIDPAQLSPGDLVFFEPRADGPGHVGMYVGSDFFIEAPHTGDVVKFARLSTEARKLGFVGASRPAA